MTIFKFEYSIVMSYKVLALNWMMRYVEIENNIQPINNNGLMRYI